MRQIFLLLLVLSGLAGCAGNDLLVQRQVSLEGRLEQIAMAHTSDKSDYAAVIAQIQEIREQLTRQAEFEKELVAKNEALQERVKTLSNRLAQVEAAAKSPVAIELVNQDSIPEGQDESVQAAYMKAFGLFSANNYRAAAVAFESFIAAHPASEYAVNARYWLGECYFSDGLYKESIDSFSRLLEMNPPPKRGAEAMLRIGSAWYRLDNRTKGTAVLRQLLEKYPESDAARKAAAQVDGK